MNLEAEKRETETQKKERERKMNRENKRLNMKGCQDVRVLTLSC